MDRSSHAHPSVPSALWPTATKPSNARLATELYHQLNFLRDIEASSQAASDCLSLIENEGLDDSFARVNSELVSVARQVADGCSESLVACQRAAEMVAETLQAFDRIQETLNRLN
ncbi:MAG: hypothetical protein D6744_03360, partial [Planctomycetota bacterium]